MKQFLKNNWIILVVGPGLFASLVMAIYNNAVLEKNNRLLQRSEEVKERTKEILSRTMHGLDLGVRGFVLTKEDAMLIPYRESIEKNAQTFKDLHALLTAQGYNDVEKLYTVEDEINNYITFSGEIIYYARKDSNRLVLGMLKEDRGYSVWKKYDEFAKPLFTYEDSLHQTALSNYNSAMKQNLILQVATVLLALPALFLFVSRIRIERNGRQQLLAGIEKNDRTYVFDPGLSSGSSAADIIHTSIQNMRKASDFISGLAKGNYSVNWEGWSESNEAMNSKTLAGTLLNLREQLRKAKRMEDQRNWSNEGLAKFMEIIRNNQGDFQQLIDRSLSFITKQVKVHQGGFYIPDKGGANVLNLVSCYAFDKSKMIGTTIEVGSGLVGQAFQNGEVVQLKEVPKGYIKVSSGLGEAIPRHLIIIPMKYDLKTIAIVELASFTPLEDYQIDFLLRVGPFLSAAILNIQTTEKMSDLSQHASRTHEMSSRVA